MLLHQLRKLVSQVIGDLLKPLNLVFTAGEAISAAIELDRDIGQMVTAAAPSRSDDAHVIRPRRDYEANRVPNQPGLAHRSSAAQARQSAAAR